MLVSVTCNDDTCTFYRDGGCGKESISIEPTPTRDFDGGKRVVLSACQDCKEIGDDGAD